MPITRTVASIIDSILSLMDIDPHANLDEIEVLTDLVEGEIEENYPTVRVHRSNIRHYLISKLREKSAV